MARPLRFRYAPGGWSPDRVETDLLASLDENIGATMRPPWFKQPDGYEARRFDMDNGDVALFCWTGDDTAERPGGGHGPGAYWMGNTETPSVLWHTDKFGFEEVPYPVARWTQRELLAQLHEEAPWLAPFPHVSWFFLPVFLSKDGRRTTRQFFDEHAAGFPDATRDEALDFYEEILRTGALDGYRELMAGKLGTSETLDLGRMSAAMGEFDAARVLLDAGCEIVPEAEVTTGHSIDYRAEQDGTVVLVEVTRPLPTGQRAADSPVVAVRDTVATKTSGQLEEHGGGVILLVDCSSFSDDDWRTVRAEKPDVRHRPAVVFRARPAGHVEGYNKGSLPLSLDGGVEWI